MPSQPSTLGVALHDLAVILALSSAPYRVKDRLTEVAQMKAESAHHTNDEVFKDEKVETDPSSLWGL